jgi:predicted adenine nucleotide alpha hydrolase (AANH) superfamily ATPase
MVKNLEQETLMKQYKKELKDLNSQYINIAREYQTKFFGLTFKRNKDKYLTSDDVCELHKITSQLYLISTYCIRQSRIHLNSKAVHLNIKIHDFIRDYSKK